MGGTSANIQGGGAKPLQTTSLLPQVFQGGGFVNAQADLSANVADLLMLSDGSRIETGKVIWTAHGLTEGAYYFLSQTAAGVFTSTVPESGIYQRLFFVEDADTIHVDIEPALIIDAGAGLAGVTYFKELPADRLIVNWAAPWTPLALTALDIVVPAGGKLVARYVLRLASGNGGYSIGLRNRGFATGDLITGVLDLPNYTPPAGAAGGNWYKFFFTEAVWDNAPNSARQIDSAFSPNANSRLFLDVTYKNNTAGAKTFGWDFGADTTAALTALNLAVKAGSSVSYTIF